MARVKEFLCFESDKVTSWPQPDQDVAIIINALLESNFFQIIEFIEIMLPVIHHLSGLLIIFLLIKDHTLGL